MRSAWAFMEAQDWQKKKREMNEIIGITNINKTRSKFPLLFSMFCVRQQNKQRLEHGLT